MATVPLDRFATHPEPAHDLARDRGEEGDQWNWAGAWLLASEAGVAYGRRLVEAEARGHVRGLLALWAERRRLGWFRV